MAIKKPVKKKDAAKPGTVLIVFLVIFVLASIGLGVLAWFGYREQDDLKKAAESAKASEKTMKANRDYRVILVYLFGSAAGFEKLNEGDRTFADLEIDEIFKEGSKYKDEDRLAFAKAFDEVKKELGWDGKKFGVTYTAKLKQLSDDKAKAEAQFAAAEEKRKDWETKYNSYVNTIVAFDKTRSTSIQKDNQSAIAERTKQSEAVVNLLGQIQNLQKQKTDSEAAAQADIEKLNIELGRARKFLDEKKNPLQEVMRGRTGDQHALFLDLSRGIPLWDRPVGKVTRVDLDKRLVYIDIGSEHGVRPELTFSVFADDGKGQADKFLKGTIEVIRVDSATGSTCRITSLYDASGAEIALNDPTRGRAAREVEDAIRKDDLIFNMFWGSRVAVAGVIGLNQSISDAPSEQMRQLIAFGQVLERMNIRLDSYLDLNEGKIKGEISPKTRFLILGDLAYPKNPTDEGQKERAKALNDLIGAMKKDALDKGVFLISADNFMIASGYRAPRNSLDNAVSKFHGSAPFAGAAATGLIIQRERPGVEAAPMEKKEPDAKEKKEPDAKEKDAK